MDEKEEEEEAWRQDLPFLQPGDADSRDTLQAKLQAALNLLKARNPHSRQCLRLAHQPALTTRLCVQVQQARLELSLQSAGHSGAAHTQPLAAADATAPLRERNSRPSCARTASVAKPRALGFTPLPKRLRRPGASAAAQRGAVVERSAGAAVPSAACDPLAAGAAACGATAAAGAAAKEGLEARASVQPAAGAAAQPAAPAPAWPPSPRPAGAFEYTTPAAARLRAPGLASGGAGRAPQTRAEAPTSNVPTATRWRSASARPAGRRGAARPRRQAKPQGQPRLQLRPLLNDGWRRAGSGRAPCRADAGQRTLAAASSSASDEGLSPPAAGSARAHEDEDAATACADDNGLRIPRRLRPAGAEPAGASPSQARAARAAVRGAAGGAAQDEQPGASVERPPWRRKRDRAALVQGADGAGQHAASPASTPREGAEGARTSPKRARATRGAVAAGHAEQEGRGARAERSGEPGRVGEPAGGPPAVRSQCAECDPGCGAAAAMPLSVGPALLLGPPPAASPDPQGGTFGGQPDPPAETWRQASGDSGRPGLRSRAAAPGAAAAASPSAGAARAGALLTSPTAAAGPGAAGERNAEGSPERRAPAPTAPAYVPDTCMPGAALCAAGFASQLPACAEDVIEAVPDTPAASQPAQQARSQQGRAGPAPHGAALEQGAPHRDRRLSLGGGNTAADAGAARAASLAARQTRSMSRGDALGPDRPSSGRGAGGGAGAAAVPAHAPGDAAPGGSREAPAAAGGRPGAAHAGVSPPTEAEPRGPLHGAHARAAPASSSPSLAAPAAPLSVPDAGSADGMPVCGGMCMVSEVHQLPPHAALGMPGPAGQLSGAQPCAGAACSAAADGALGMRFDRPVRAVVPCLSGGCARLRPPSVVMASAYRLIDCSMVWWPVLASPGLRCSASTTTATLPGDLIADEAHAHAQELTWLEAGAQAGGGLPG